MKKCISTILATLLLLGGTGMVLGQHLCEGVVVNIALTFGAEKLNCDGEKADDTCDDSAQDDECCADVYYQIKTNTDVANKSFDSVLELPVFDKSFSLCSGIEACFINKNRHNTQYLPPDFKEDRQSLYQVFVI